MSQLKPFTDVKGEFLCACVCWGAVHAERLRSGVEWFNTLVNLFYSIPWVVASCRLILFHAIPCIVHAITCVVHCHSICVISCHFVYLYLYLHLCTCILCRELVKGVRELWSLITVDDFLFWSVLHFPVVSSYRELSNWSYVYYCSLLSVTLG